MVASIVMGVVVYFLHASLCSVLGNGFIREFSVLIITVGVGVLVYAAIVYMLKVKEVEWIINIIKDKLGGGVRGC